MLPKMHIHAEIRPAGDESMRMVPEFASPIVHAVAEVPEVNSEKASGREV